MVFSSLEFLLWFLPFFLGIYYLVPGKYRNLCLFVFSMVFYAYGTLRQPLYLLLLLASAAVNYIFGRLIGRTQGRGRQGMLVLGLIYNLGLLVFFKFGGLPMPIGISFYTFQAVSYLVDVYRGTVACEKKPGYVVLYLTMFPQLISGPITRFSRIRARLAERVCSRKPFLRGMEIFLVGLGFKVLLANRFGGLWKNIGGIGYESVSVPLAWMGIVAYSLQIYFDFYGYSLMAMGLGKMIGFSLPVNFRHPYLSCTMTEFWRRWHITLGSWFRDYVYIPLGGNRQGKGRTYLNLLIVWCLTGIWHGNGWNFLIWGLFLFAVIAIEKLWIGRYLNGKRWLGHLYMILLIPLSWLIFAVTDLRQLGIYLGRLVGIGGVNVFAGDFVKYLEQYGIFLVIGLLFATGLPEKLFFAIRRRGIRWVLLLAVLAGSLYGIYMGMNDPFLYFQF